MIEGFLFFSAFFSFSWLLFVFIFWLFHHKKTLVKVREKAWLSYEKVVRGTGFINGILRYIFAIFYAHILFPAAGVIIALTLIVLFVIFRNT